MTDTVRLSRFFTLREFTRSQVASRHGIVNAPDADQVSSMVHLCVDVLDPVREALGVVLITSGFRCDRLNEFIGGSGASQHRYGQAADFEVPGRRNLEVARWVRENVPSFDQLILEFYQENDPSSGWVHVSHVRGGANCKEVLTARRVVDANGRARVEYLYGLPTGRPWVPYA